jgi:hypothetical protein
MQKSILHAYCGSVCVLISFAPTRAGQRNTQLDQQYIFLQTDVFGVTETLIVRTLTTESQSPNNIFDLNELMYRVHFV